MKTRYITAIAAAALMLCGCQRESLTDTVGFYSDDVVKFVPTLSGGSGDASSKGTLYNESGSSESLGKYVDEFMVAAWSSETARIIPDADYALIKDEDRNGKLDFAEAGCISGDEENGFYQKVMKRTGADGSEYWMTVQPQTVEEFKETIPFADDEYIWKEGETKTFFAYANLPASGAKVANTAATTQTLEYNVPAAATDQTDILLGVYSGDGKTGAEESKKMTGTASIKFYHPLTAVRFKEGTLTGMTGIRSITLSGLASGGSVTMTANGIGDWTLAEGEKYNTSATLSGGDGSLSVEDGTKLIGTDADGHYNGAFLLVPQNLASEGGHPVTVTVVLTTADGDVTVSADITSGEWEAGKTNTYTLNIIDWNLTVTGPEVYNGGRLGGDELGDGGLNSYDGISL